MNLRSMPRCPGQLVIVALVMLLGESCAARSATSPLKETYWKLTHLEDKPVILADRQREPSLVFRSQESRVTGFSGCNSMTGAYKLDGDQVTIDRVIATKMACLQGMEIEGAVFKALEQVRSWKIAGRHLELYDSGGKMLARFEARPVQPVK